MPLLFRHRFPFRARAAAGLALLGLGVFLLCSPQMLASHSHQKSELEYARAVSIQRRLQAKPVAQRTRLDYERALDAYRAVYHGDPASPDAARSIAAVADLLANEGRYAHERKLLHDAVEQWEFLRQQYPTNVLRKRALFEEAQLEQLDLHDPAAAKQLYRSLLLHYSQDPLAEQARAGLQGHAVAEEDENRTMQPLRTEAHRTEAPLHDNRLARGEKNHAPSALPSRETTQENAQDLVQPNSSPKATTSAKSLPKATILQDVRYWAENGSTRLAVDLSGTVPYHIYSAQEGRQITFVFFGANAAQTLLGHPIPASHDDNLRSMRVSMLTGNQATLVLQLKHPMSFTSFALSNPSRVILDLQPALSTDFGQIETKPVPQTSAENMHANSTPTKVFPVPKASSNTQVLPSTGAVETATRRPVPPPLPSDPIKPTGNLQPANNLQPSMARVLGLRVRRIVIDAGHGGHDSGTIGPDGLEEKDVALDVALRLGRLLQQRLAAQVIYTRRTDKFVPLEERTAIANAAHADLFLSIHANSSSDPQVRGVETYFLNFTASPDAMAVAARENADSNRSVYELSDLVRKIALSDKIDESRAFAADVQQQLYCGLAPGNPGLKNRGVKQAPFVVLIGAQMPSILAEISFLTNPESEVELARPAYRERLAKALYRGVAEYVQGMSGVRIAKTIPTETLADTAE